MRGQNTYRGAVQVLKGAHNARNFTQCDSILIGDQCGAHTFPYIDVRNPSAHVEHEATTSKIGEDQIFYCNQRGISTEDAVSMIVNGFCKEVMAELPMEFAVEAKNSSASASKAASVRSQFKEQNNMLEIRNLHAGVEGAEILHGIDLVVNAGEIHAIMGPNGSGKSTLAQVLAGHEAYSITAGEVIYEGQDLLDMDPDERAVHGVFLAFQYPVEIPGVNSAYFLRTALNAIRTARDEEEVDAIDFSRADSQQTQTGRNGRKIPQTSGQRRLFWRRKKRHEILQMAVLEPRLAILDETDSGLDIDALRIVADGVNTLHSADKATIVVTHSQRLLNNVIPDVVHVMIDGRIVQSGDKTLAMELEEKGYDWIKEEHATHSV